MSDIYAITKCPKCGYKVEDDFEPTTADESNWAYSKTSDANYMDALRKSEIRMKEELSYGVPEAEDLGSTITGQWSEQKIIKLETEGKDAKRKEKK